MRRAACGGHWSQGGLTGSHQSPPVLPPVSQTQPRAFTQGRPQWGGRGGTGHPWDFNISETGDTIHQIR